MGNLQPDTTQEVFTKYPPISPKSTPGNQLAEQVSPPPPEGLQTYSNIVRASTVEEQFAAMDIILIRWWIARK
jgi:hypothetical protein